MTTKTLSSEEYLKIRSIANTVRNNLVESYCDEYLTECCVPASKELKTELEKVGIKTVLVNGYVKLDEEFTEVNEEGEEVSYWTLPHSFLTYKNHIIDITYSQFKHYIDNDLEQIYISEINYSDNNHFFYSYV